MLVRDVRSIDGARVNLRESCPVALMAGPQCVFKQGDHQCGLLVEFRNGAF